MLLLFAFEYVIQASNVIRYFLKYIMSSVDLWLDGRWESKVRACGGSDGCMHACMHASVAGNMLHCQGACG